MSGFALGLVLLSAVAHAGWNYLLKRGSNQEVFVWWAQVSISVLLLPLALFLAWRYPIIYPGWWFIIGTIVLHILYFVFLGRSYRHADLSIVYPVARGIGPALVPILAVVLLDETISPPAIAGIVAVVLGIYTAYWWGQASQIFSDPFRLLKEPGTRYAVMTGLIIAAYSMWDKVGVRYVNPFLYMYLMSFGVALGMAPYLLRSCGTGLIRTEWRISSRGIVVVALLMFLAYGLVLTTLQFSRVSYIWPSREVGIVIGVLLGVLVLKEPYGTGRILGSCLIVLGLVLIVLAP